MENISIAPTELTEQFLFAPANYPNQAKSYALPLLRIDENIITVEQAFKYLQDSGELPKFLLEISRQYIIEQEIKQLEFEEPSVEILEQFMLEFRFQQGLTTINKFHIWLANQGLSYQEFRTKIQSLIQFETFKKNLTEPQLESYFLEKKKDLEKVVLSRIVVEDEQIAQNLKDRIEQDAADFNQLAKEYSIVDDAIIGGVLGAVIRGDMPEIIAQATDQALPGTIIGPMAIENRFCLLKVEEILTPSFDEALQKELGNKIFDQWLKERLQTAKIRLLPLEQHESYGNPRSKNL